MRHKSGGSAVRHLRADSVTPFAYRCGGSAGWVATACDRPSCFPFNLAETGFSQSTNSQDGSSRSGAVAVAGTYNHAHCPTCCCLLALPGQAVDAMSRLEDLAERIDRLVARHEALKRSNAQLSKQLAELSHEHHSLQARLGAALRRLDALSERLPEHAGGTLAETLAQAAAPAATATAPETTAVHAQAAAPAPATPDQPAA